jgi:NADH dehydrogenase
VFGAEDNFFNRFGRMALLSPALPLIGGGRTRFQPVYVGDVAAAIVSAIDMLGAAGQLYELGGPQVYSFAELMRRLLDNLGRRRMLVPLPFPIASLMGSVMQCLPNPQLTADQVKLLKRDNVVSDNAKGLDALGITPTSVEAILPTYLDRFRVHGDYNHA